MYLQMQKEFKTDVNANSIKVKSYNSADVVEYDREDRELSIEREGKNHQGEKDPIEIILPQDMQFESVTVEMNGGGQLVIDKLNAASLDLEVGAGVLQVSDELRAQECEIEVGAGEVSVAKLDAKVSDISCGGHENGRKKRGLQCRGRGWNGYCSDWR